MIATFTTDTIVCECVKNAENITANLNPARKLNFERLEKHNFILLISVECKKKKKNAKGLNIC